MAQNLYVKYAKKFALPSDSLLSIAYSLCSSVNQLDPKKVEEGPAN
jgi:hypothetical protein